MKDLQIIDNNNDNESDNGINNNCRRNDNNISSENDSWNISTFDLHFI